MRRLALLAATAIALSFAQSAYADEIDVCVKAAAAADHIKSADVDRESCVCATKELQTTMRPGDFDLHEKMLEIIGSGANEKAFNKQMSDIMLQRGMKQTDVDAFLARSKKAETAAKTKCDSSPLLDRPIPYQPSL